jgi:hypothetical protein
MFYSETLPSQKSATNEAPMIRTAFFRTKQTNAAADRPSLIELSLTQRCGEIHGYDVDL